MSIFERIQCLEEEYGEFKKVEVRFPEFIEDKNDLMFWLLYEPEGSVKETIIAYRSILNEIELRAVGRGFDMFLRLSEKEFVFDEYGPITSRSIKLLKFELSMIKEAFEALEGWLKEKI